MKRLLLSLVAVVLLVSMMALAVGCSSSKDGQPGSGSNDSSTDAGGKSDGKQLIVATVPKIIGLLWFDSMDDYGKEWAAANNAKHHYVGPKEVDPAQQLIALNDAIALQPDILTVVPIAAEACDEALKKARDAGTIVVTHEGSTLKNVDYNVEAFNNKDFGEHFLEIMVEQAGDDIEYALTVGRLTVPSHNEWAQALYAAQVEKYPNMKSVTGDTPVESRDTAATGYEVAKQLIQTYPNIKAIFAGSASSTLGIARAVEEMDLVGEVHVIGVCPPSETAEGFERGSLIKGSFWIPGLAQQACYEVGKRVLAGETIKEGDNLGVEGYESITIEGKTIMGRAWIDIDKDNVKDFVEII